MKVLSFALMSMLSSSALAVPVASCPEALSIEMGTVHVSTSFEDLMNSVAADDKENEIGIAFDNLTDLSGEERNWDLTSAKNGRCVYRGSNEEKAEIYTLKGEDRLMFQIVAGDKGLLLRVYAKVAALLKDEVTLKTKPTIHLAVPRTPYENYSAGGPLVYLGNVSQLKVSVP